MAEIYCTDLPNVMHEMIDDEVVVVNLESGAYYSLDGTGGQIWSLLDGEGRSMENLIAEVTKMYQGEREHISSEVTKFIQQLQDENIINITSGEDVADHAVDGVKPSLPFEAPALQKYTDMESMLLVDPIHEVTDAGWPNLK